jgi:hypothetical protein
MHRGTRTPEGVRPRRGNGPVPAVRTTANPLWPGITWGCNALCGCTWAIGPTSVYEVKAGNMSCPVHARALRSGRTANPAPEASAS